MAICWHGPCSKCKRASTLKKADGMCGMCEDKMSGKSIDRLFEEILVMLEVGMEFNPRRSRIELTETKLD